MTTTELPEDLVEEILCRVPATNLKRLRSTCKRWDRLFNNMRFATKHSHKAAKEFQVLILTPKFRIRPVIINLFGIIPSVEVKSELSLLDPHSYNSCQFNIYRVFHCDGLLLCTDVDESRLVVWNPCTSQIKWIKADRKKGSNFVLGYYQDNDSSYKTSYKILRFSDDASFFPEIYEFSSDSWRVLDHHIAPSMYSRCLSIWVSLKGNTYRLATHVTQNSLGTSLLKFDFSTEKFELVPLPSECPIYRIMLLSIVKEEKLSIIIKREKTSKTEIWMTSKIGETKALSWSKVLELDWILNSDVLSYHGNFLFDEENNFVLFCNRWIHDNNNVVYIVGEDNKMTPVDLGLHRRDLHWLNILNYAPSLAQIQQAEGKKKKEMRLGEKIWLEENSETTSNDEHVIFDKSIIPWWAWIT